jgi:hypothetical protein
MPNDDSLTTDLSNLSLDLSLVLRPTVSRPVYLGIKHPTGAYDQIFITVRQLRVCWFRALFLTRGRVCPSPMGLVIIFYSLRFETFLFVASYDSQGYGGDIRPRLHTCPPFITFWRTEQRSPSLIVILLFCLSGAVETSVSFAATIWFLQAYPMLCIRVSESRRLVMDISVVLLRLHTSGIQASCHNIYKISFLWE